MKYAFTGLTIEEQFLQPPNIITECMLTPENDVDRIVLNKLLKGCTVYADSNESLPAIKNVYFNPPATVVLWDDGTKTVVKCQDGDTYSKETGLALCMAKKAMGNNSRQFNDIFKKWIPDEKKAVVPKGCSTCRYFDGPITSEDCYLCDMLYSNWTPKK